jgi:hypothetical protein
MMHVNAARDEMTELGNELFELINVSKANALYLIKIIGYISADSELLENTSEVKSNN